MSNTKKFKDLDEAQIAYDEVVSSKKQEQDKVVEKALESFRTKQQSTIDKAVSAAVKDRDVSIQNLNKTLGEKDAEIVRLTKRAEDAEEVANSAIELASNPGKEPTVTIDKKKYRVLFGVEGKSKEDIRLDNDLILKLVSKGSAAIEVLN